VTLSTINQTN